MRKSYRLRTQLDRVAHGNRALMDQVTFEFRRNVHKSIEVRERRLEKLQLQVAGARQQLGWYERMAMSTDKILQQLALVDVECADVGLAAIIEDGPPTTGSSSKSSSPRRVMHRTSFID